MRRSAHPSGGHLKELQDEIPTSAKLKLDYVDPDLGWVQVWMDKDMNPVFFHRGTLQFIHDLNMTIFNDDYSSEALRAVRFFSANEVEHFEIVETKQFQHGMPVGNDGRARKRSLK